MPTNARDATYVAPPSAAATTAVTSTMVRNALSAADRFVCSPATDMWTPPEWLVLTRTHPSAPALSVAGHDLVTVAGVSARPPQPAGWPVVARRQGGLRGYGGQVVAVASRPAVP